MNVHVPAYVCEHGPLQAPLRISRMTDQIEHLLREPAWLDGERVGKTLVKEHGLSVVLTLVREGAGLHEHHVDGASMLHCLRGRLKLHSLGREIELGEGEIAALEAGIAHRVEALSDCALLMVLAEQTDEAAATR